MKKVILVITLSICIGRFSYSQTATVPFQFYLDLNNNCTYDSGDQPVIFNNFSAKLNYLNSQSIFSNTTCGPSYGGCTSPGFTVNNYALPPSNSLVVNGFPQLIPDYSCASYYNLPYNGTTVNLPLKKTNGIGRVNFISGNVTYTGSATTTAVSIYDKFPVCSNIGNDTVEFNFQYCPTLSCIYTGGTSVRTYSLYLDGLKFDQITTNGQPLVFNYNIPGINNKCRLTEIINTAAGGMYFRTLLPSGISALGSHIFSIKSTSIYPHPLSVIDYSCVLNTFPCNKISGWFYKDCNNNCAKDANESGLGYGIQGKVDDSGGASVVFSPNPGGYFSVFLPTASSYSITQYPVVSGYTACTTTTLAFPAGSSTTTLSFGYSSQFPYQNTSHYIHASRYGLNFLPGANFEVEYTNKLSTAGVCNNTTVVVSGSQKIVLKKFLTYVNTTSGPSPTSIIPGPNGDTLVWITNDFTSLAAGLFSVAISPTVSLLTPFTLEGNIYLSNDDFIGDNKCLAPGVVGAPFDPNSKVLSTTGLQPNGNIVYSDGQEMDYTIHFQNLGTAPAINVKTLDTIDVNLDLSSIKILGSSYPANFQVDYASRLVVFMFDGINLSDAASNEKGSHGYVRYSINLNNGLPVNTRIKNRAHNYFDFTEPVATNQTNNKLVVVTGIRENNLADNRIILMPNPFSDILNVSSKQVMKSIEIYNMIGQLELQVKPNAMNLDVDFSSLPCSAIYFISVRLEDGSLLTQKVIKN